MIIHQENVAAVAGAHTSYWLLQPLARSRSKVALGIQENVTLVCREFLFDQAQHKVSNRYYLEAYFRATTGTGHVELYDVTAAAVVAGSRVTNATSTLARLRSGAITLVDGNQYQTRLVVADGDVGGYLASVIVEQSN